MTDVERGRRMRELREAVGLLQRQVGAAFDIDKAAVSEWERGRSSPDKAKLVKLDEMYQAGGEVLNLYGVGVPSIDELVTRLAAIEQVAREGVPVLGLLDQQVRALIGRVEALEAEVRALQRRPPRRPASGE